MDFDVSNYTDDELLEILNIDEATPDSVRRACDDKIAKYANASNIFLEDFFRGVRLRFFPQYIEGFAPFRAANDDDDDDEDDPRDTADEDDEDEDGEDEDNEDIPLGTSTRVLPEDIRSPAPSDSFSVPVKQDSLNPNLKNVFQRFVNLDSQFRLFTNGTSSSSTAYTCTLSDVLKNTTSIFLHSYQIPYSWYTIDSAYGNTCFWIFFSTPSSQAVAISLPPGNYSSDVFVQELNASFVQAGFTSDNPVVTYSPTQGVLTMSLFGSTWTDGETIYTVSETTRIVFYDFSGTFRCSVNCSNGTNRYFNNTLGWLMGFRFPNVAVSPDGNRASAILDLNGPKYLIVALDDYNRNHVNNTMVSIARPNNILKLPPYATPTNPHICLPPEAERSDLLGLMGGVAASSVLNSQTLNAENGAFSPDEINSYRISGQAQNGLIIGGKYQHEYQQTRVDLPSAPRTLTNAQLSTINSIQSNNNNLTNYLTKAPTTSDILAVIPIKTSGGVPTGSLLVEFSGSLQNNRRTYFGPVDIERVRVKLMDDKGNQLNLNGNDWCMTIVAECLYQY